MKTLLPLRYLLIPAIVGWVMVFFSSFLFLMMLIEDLMKVAALASLIAFLGSGLATYFVTPFLASLARGEFVGFKAEREYRKDIQFTVRAETQNGAQVDFFQGLKPEQWRDCALRISAHVRAGNRSFTYAIVGQTERPILVPIMFAAGYIVPVGNGEWELTEDGARWWLSFAAVPYPYEHVPEKIRRLLNL